jgi:tetratricopeptide (TPR) repeat protein
MGPSKEELANYFKNNRKYFDELAQHYKKSDTEYYNKYIAPFYSISFSLPVRERGTRPVIAVFAAAMFVFIMGIVLFFLVNQKSDYENINYDGDENENEIVPDNLKLLDSIKEIKELSDYDKGIIYFQLGEFDKAEKYLEKVPENNSKYEDARLKLIEVKKKKWGKK